MTDNTSRRGYLNDIGNGWLLECEVRCFRNFMHNWDGAASDRDFFDLFRDGDALGDWIGPCSPPPGCCPRGARGRT